MRGVPWYCRFSGSPSFVSTSPGSSSVCPGAPGLVNSSQETEMKFSNPREVISELFMIGGAMPLPYIVTYYKGEDKVTMLLVLIIIVLAAIYFQISARRME